MTELVELIASVLQTGDKLLVRRGTGPYTLELVNRPDRHIDGGSSDEPHTPGTGFDGGEE